MENGTDLRRKSSNTYEKREASIRRPNIHEVSIALARSHYSRFSFSDDDHEVGTATMDTTTTSYTPIDDVPNRYLRMV